MFEKEVKKYLEDSTDYYDPREPLTSRKVLQMCMDCAWTVQSSVITKQRRTSNVNIDFKCAICHFVIKGCSSL